MEIQPAVGAEILFQTAELAPVVATRSPVAWQLIVTRLPFANWLVADALVVGSVRTARLVPQAGRTTTVVAGVGVGVGFGVGVGRGQRRICGENPLTAGVRV